jgi:hypothetical protein
MVAGTPESYSLSQGFSIISSFATRLLCAVPLERAAGSVLNEKYTEESLLCQVAVL